MLVAIVTFPAPAEAPADPRALLEATAPAYREVAGLVRKYFIGNERAAGGVYQWRDRESAERYFDESWRVRMRERYDVEPAVEFFDAPCVVDNAEGAIHFAA